MCRTYPAALPLLKPGTRCARLIKKAIELYVEALEEDELSSPGAELIRVGKGLTAVVKSPVLLSVAALLFAG